MQGSLLFGVLIILGDNTGKNLKENFPCNLPKLIV